MRRRWGRSDSGPVDRSRSLSVGPVACVSITPRSAEWAKYRADRFADNAIITGRNARVGDGKRRYREGVEENRAVADREGGGLQEGCGLRGGRPASVEGYSDRIVAATTSTPMTSASSSMSNRAV